jgi:hypothetical protein
VISLGNLSLGKSELPNIISMKLKLRILFISRGIKDDTLQKMMLSINESLGKLNHLAKKAKLSSDQYNWK